MKIALVSQADFNEIFRKLVPQEREFLDAPHEGMIVRVADTLVLLGTQEDLVSAQSVLESIKGQHTIAAERRVMAPPSVGLETGKRI